MRSIIQDDKVFCYYFSKSAKCQGYATEAHHIFGASNRKHSEEDGLVIYVCRHCHNSLHGGNGYMERVKELRAKAQKIWEENYEGEGKPRDAFMKRYGKNWI